jgi:hypothetical protein
MAAEETIYASTIFFNAVLPLVKHVKEGTNLNTAFTGKSGVIQVSARDGDELWGTHFIVENGDFSVCLGTHPSPDVELAFPSLESFNAFFRGTSKKLPKIKGFSRLGLLVPTFKVLLTMASLLGAVEIPKSSEQKALLVRLYFYLLSSGISQLNKSGHPSVSRWAQTSPDRVYAWLVDGHPDAAAFIRVKAGKTKASRGRYTRSKPFFTMRFDSLDSALGILLAKDDMLESVASGKLVMEGAPEFGSQIGEYMMLVGSYAKP